MSWASSISCGHRTAVSGTSKVYSAPRLETKAGRSAVFVCIARRVSSSHTPAWLTPPTGQNSVTLRPRVSRTTAAAQSSECEQDLIPEVVELNDTPTVGIQEDSSANAAPAGLASWALAPRHAALTTLLAVGGGGLLGTGFDISGPSSYLGALAVLAAIITVHECGHFFAARLQGIHVTKFAIGFGPPLVTYQGPEVEYTLRAIPLGGFVAFPGDEEPNAPQQESQPPNPYPADDPDLLKNRPILDRAIVISAGVIANIIFGFAVCFTQVNTVGVTSSYFKPGVLVGDVSAGQSASRAGLQSGDLILRIGDVDVPASKLQVPLTIKSISGHPNEALPLLVERDGQRVKLTVVPNERGRIGIMLSSNAELQHKTAGSLGEGLQMAGKEFGRFWKTVTSGLTNLFTNFSKSASTVSGPIAIVAAGADVARTDSAGIFSFAAIININLAVINMLPLPALDGGYMVLLLLEAVRGGKKLPQALENGILASGVLLLTGLGALLLVHDTLNLLPKSFQ